MPCSRGVDIAVATPGRLQDLMNQGYVRLDQVEILVLDEADRMLDMGFINDVKRIVKTLPKRRQTLLFSATMPPAIQELSKSILTNPVHVDANPQSSTVESIRQSIYFVDSGDKRALLKFILQDANVQRALVFTRTKHRANNLAKQLNRAGIPAEAIHGNKSQSARTRALAQFKSGATAVLVATDIAARGLDIDAVVSHVINFDLPNIAESYVHRIGRTARAGASGIAYSFCDRDERKYLYEIEKLISQPITVVSEHPYARLSQNGQTPVPASRPSEQGARKARSRRRRRQRT